MKRLTILAVFTLLSSVIAGQIVAADGLTDVRQRGTLRHLGIPYANFVTGKGDGLCVEVMQGFASYLGVEYEYVRTNWQDVFGDLIGKTVYPEGEDVSFGKRVAIRGDLIANGLTVLPWREKAVKYSTPTFPTQVWLITASNSGLKPIHPSGDINRDIAATKALLRGRHVLGKAGTCLDPSLYKVTRAGARPELFDGNLNDLAPAVINGLAETAILDVPDALVALSKWPGRILVLGPISPPQVMGVGFRPADDRLRQAFNNYYDRMRKDGTYQALVRKYYPAVFDYYPDFFSHPLQ
ncbi:MAG: transporter substrate-binding domain-containing protein [Thermodesulfobacteriota bacterium]|nr:transporter substrate-binding domain-containing protein [Thermodesulfobacteriota bacterium]